MHNNCLPSLERYHFHLKQTSEWCLRSAAHGSGGSCAHYSPILGWSRPYPETTGYLIPTLIKLAETLRDGRFLTCAIQLGGWLLEVQNDDGSWCGGLHPAKKPSGSVFNTGQILKGMTALYRLRGEDRWIEAGTRGAAWLAARVNSEGLWPPGDYQSAETPSYYTHVAWPMLEVWSLTGETELRNAAERFLNTVIHRIQDDGSISKWGFTENSPAFTHTIAYTIRGLQEAARILDEYERYAAPVEPALEIIYRKSGISNGRLPGSFGNNWQATANYVCLTGNAQLAICLLKLEAHKPDLRLVDSAAKLVDFVAKTQRGNFLSGTRGAVAGSWPLWGRYMFMRYPNWAAKYFCDALMMLSERIARESMINSA